MNITPLIAIAVFLAPSASAALISTALTADGSSTPFNGGMTIAKTLDDGFAYNPNTPTTTTPNLGDGSGVPGFHGDAGTSHYVRYLFTGGPVIASGGQAQDFVVDLWGRNAASLNARDNNLIVTLYNGDYTTAVATSALFSIPDTGTPYFRVNFDLADGVTFDRFQVSGNVQYMTLAEVRAAVQAVPEPETYGLLGAGALASAALLRRRRRA